MNSHIGAFDKRIILKFPELGSSPERIKTQFLDLAALELYPKI